MKVAVCPWCEGEGSMPIYTVDSIPGSESRIDFADCKKCEGSGVIAFKALKQISDLQTMDSSA